MRIVIDSSVLVAAIARPGVCTELVEEVARDHSLILSEFILAEVERKLREKFGVPASEAAELASGIGRQAELVAPSSVPETACRDPKDLPVLGTAVAGRAGLLVTVDKDLLALESFQGIPIVKPGGFWQRQRGA